MNPFRNLLPDPGLTSRGLGRLGRIQWVPCVVPEGPDLRSPSLPIVGGGVRERFPTLENAIGGKPSSLTVMLVSGYSWLPVRGRTSCGDGRQVRSCRQPRRQRDQTGASTGSDPPIPRAQRESPSFFELPCERRSGPAEPSPEHGNHPVLPRSGSSATTH